MKNLFRFLNSKLFVLIFTLIVNVILFITLSILIRHFLYYLSAFQVLIMIISFICICASKDNSTYKVAWAVLIVALPLFGVVLFGYTKGNKGSKRLRRRWQELQLSASQYVQQNPDILDKLAKLKGSELKNSGYILSVTNYPVVKNSSVKYINSGEEYYNNLFYEINNATKYILLEYYQIQEGRVWQDLFTLLKQKAREGVEIKLLYDDWGCMNAFPKDKQTFEKLKNHNIETLAFNKLKNRLTPFANYRDHRKIAVIDGKVGFLGGVNIADEYANLVSPYGHFKDSAVQLVGDAVWSLVIMFANSWKFCTTEPINIESYMLDAPNKIKADEFVQPFCSSPLSNDNEAKSAYLNMINSAKNKLYITTPYFVIDDEIRGALKLSSLSGVDVRIIFPSVPDKRGVFYLARTYFAELICCGVKMYEYIPGFIHSKMIWIDDESAIIGSINLDFRSMFLQFENGVLIHGGQSIVDMGIDLENTMLKCRLLTMKDIKSRKFKEKCSGALLKMFAPLI